ncbi:MAG: hypothetical protein KF819_19945, partial [Labilithrix sp.]|nr:hypothetical protein [Labilithrix sp.]
AVAEAPRELGVRGPRDATVARLAVDDALARGDREATLRRATRGHVPAAEVAARALLLERQELATEIASSVLAADPTASGAQMVKAAIAVTAGNAGKAADGLAKVSDQPPELCALLFADRLAIAAGNEAARAWLARITFTPMAAHDPLAGPLATDLVARGILPPRVGPAERVSATPGERPPAND